MPSLKHARGPLQVLVLPPTSRDAQITAEVLGSAGVTTLACPTIERLCQEIEAGAGAVLLSEEHLLNDQRQLLKATLNAQPTWSDIPVLVLTLPQGACVATLRTWQQSANVTLLSRPLNIDHFVAVVQSRLRDRKRQYVVRNLLESVEQRSREFKQLADAMPQMVFIADRDGRVEFLNQRAVDYTGSPLDPTADFAACFSVKPIDARRVAKRWGLAVASQTSFNCEFRTHHHDTGVYRWQLARAEAMRDASGVVRQWYGTCTDIHERKMAERKLASALKQSDSANVAKSEFLANMSHEIRTPMTAILGYSELLAEQETDPEKRRHMEVIQRNGGFLLDIINDILDLSKIEAGKLAVDFEPVELRSFADEIRSLLDVRAQERGLELNIDIDHSAPVAIRTDPTRLRQIIVNLLGNAIKFTHEGSVRLAVSYDNNEARFDVSDSGVGMSEDQVDRLFEPFYQGDTSVSRQYGGTGLGLAISQRLASMLDGVIDVQSSLGVGSMFTLRLQAEDASDAIATRPGANSGANGRPGVLDLGRWRILVVDDRRDVRFLSGRILDKAGATVDYAEDGVEATDLVERQMAERRAPHLVLMDMQMPKMDGYSATQRLRSLGFQRPIIALTADAMHGDLTRCIECGCDAYLSKPIDSSEMLRVVSQHLRADSEASSGEL